MISGTSRNVAAHGSLYSRLFVRRSSNVPIEENLRPIEEFTRRLINANAVGGADHKHRNVDRLWSTIPQSSRPITGLPSFEKAQFISQNQALPESHLDPIQADVSYDDTRPGTFVELRRNRVVTQGVVLRMHIMDSRMHSFTLTYTGEIWPHLINDITYSIPNFVSQDLMQRVGPAPEAADTAETVARLQVVENIRKFTREHERQFNSMGKHITGLYDHLRHQDPNRWTDITTQEAARYLDVRRPPPVLTLFSVHAHMMSRPLYFVGDARNHKTTHRFSIRPLSHVQTILQVNDWVRTRDPVFQSFVEKARVIIKTARRIRTQHWSGPPSQAMVTLPTWSSSDLTFIRYLQNALRTVRTIQEDPYENALPGIVKQLGLYNDQVVGPALAHKMLCELGIIAPWDDVVTRTPEFRLEIAPPGESRQARAVDELVHHYLHFPAAPMPSITRQKLLDVHLEGSTELLQRDPHEAVRHDFGDMRVYIVDDIAAKELDDGLSIEPAPGEDGNYWVHVHIADPTTLIPPGHVFDMQARENAVTFYSAHRTWPMLPTALTQPLFSLGSKTKGQAQPVLTFSVKMSSRAEFLDYTVRPGVVRNLHILQYDQVDRLLGLEHSYRTYPLPGTRPPRIPSNPISESSLSDLQLLHDLAVRFYSRTWQKHPILTFQFPEAVVEFSSPQPTNPILSPQPILWKGHPTMVYTVESQESREKSFRRIVAEWMKLACRAASRFCLDRGLPALRRASAPLQTSSGAEMAEILAMRSPFGYVDPLECIKRNLYAPPGEPSLAPLEHWSLAIPKGEGYCRITSPLRRYGDLLMHWQIKNELLPAKDRTVQGPLFPEEYLKPIMYRLFDKEKVANGAEALYHRHWTYACLARYIETERRFHGPKFNPFPGLLGRTIAPAGFDTMNQHGQVHVAIFSLGVRGILKGIDRRISPPIGTTFPVKITEISLGLAPSLVLGLA